MPLTVLKHIAPSLNINSVKGWDTRLIYCFYGLPDSPFNYVSVAGGDYETNLFQAIKLFGDYYKGNNTFGLDRYYSTGKNLRIKGRFIVTSNDSNRLFNIWVNLDNKDLGINYQLAATNNKNDHTFFNGNIGESVPVDFEIIISFVESVEGENPIFLAQANGYYQYNLDSYSANGFNIQNAYVPIWNGGETNFIGPLNSLNSFILNINFSRSSVYKIILSYLTIEELS